MFNINIIICNIKIAAVLSVGLRSAMSDEPIIPGMEKDVEKVLAQTQATLDSINFIPLIGIEFTLVLLPFDPTEEPKYLCLLCDQRSDSRTFLQHLISIKHYVSYLVGIIFNTICL